MYFPGKGDVVHVMINFLKSLDHESWEAGIWMAAGWEQGGRCALIGQTAEWPSIRQMSKEDEPIRVGSHVF